MSTPIRRIRSARCARATSDQAAAAPAKKVMNSRRLITVAALRFFFRVTLKRSAIIEHTAFIHEPRKLPVVLSPGGGGAAARCGTGAQIQGGAERGLGGQDNSGNVGTRPAEVGDQTRCHTLPIRAILKTNQEIKLRAGGVRDVLHCGSSLGSLIS
jgi:hypothetical protein